MIGLSSNDFVDTRSQSTGSVNTTSCDGGPIVAIAFCNLVYQRQILYLTRFGRIRVFGIYWHCGARLFCTMNKAQTSFEMVAHVRFDQSAWLAEEIASNVNRRVGSLIRCNYGKETLYTW